MFGRYVALCNDHGIDIGVLWLFKATGRWILNFPTKKHWKHPTKEQYIHAGLSKFMATYEAKGIESIAFPLLGSQHGGLNPDVVLQIMDSYLRDCTIPVEIFTYDRSAPDELYDRFRDQFLALSPDEVRSATGLRTQYIDRIRNALQDDSIRQLNQLGGVDGIGAKTLEAAFRLARGRTHGDVGAVQESLFD